MYADELLSQLAALPPHRIERTLYEPDVTVDTVVYLAESNTLLIPFSDNFTRTEEEYEESNNDSFEDGLLEGRAEVRTEMEKKLNDLKEAHVKELRHAIEAAYDRGFEDAAKIYSE